MSSKAGKRTSTELARLRVRLADAEATLHAIRGGQVDAVVVQSKLGPQVYTLDSAEFDYRILIESMNEGALVLTHGGLILYANAHFARMVERPLEQLMGRLVFEVLPADQKAALGRLLKRPGRVGATMEALLQRPSGATMPAKLSVRSLPGRSARQVSIGMVVSDLTEVREREDMLRSLSHALMRMQEAERRQVATDLGDNIAQLLCSILVRCQSFAGRLPEHEQVLRREAVEFSLLLRATANDVQRISAQLRPHGLEILGLVSALRGVGAEFADRIGVPITMSCAKLTVPLAPASELALYRVLQEALRNVEKHARARHVAVTLRRRGALVELTIKDDGVGFDTTDQQAKAMRAGQFGVLSMHERATAAGGSLRVRSVPEAGTEVHLMLPLAPQAEAGR